MNFILESQTYFPTFQKKAATSPPKKCRCPSIVWGFSKRILPLAVMIKVHHNSGAKIVYIWHAKLTQTGFIGFIESEYGEFYFVENASKFNCSTVCSYQFEHTGSYMLLSWLVSYVIEACQNAARTNLLSLHLMSRWAELIGWKVVEGNWSEKWSIKLRTTSQIRVEILLSEFRGDHCNAFSNTKC